MRNEKYNRVLGVYGIVVQNGKLLVSKKTVGPYKNRFDLPGGSFDLGDSLIKGLKSTFFEETGFSIDVLKNIGVTDFMIPWKWRNCSHLHHIAIFYKVKLNEGGFNHPKHFDWHESKDLKWISRGELTPENVTPLVVKAFQWMETKSLGLKCERFMSWGVVE